MSIFTDWGSTEAERAQTYACDRLLPDATAHMFRAVDISAPPSLVFRWLCQLRVAAYSYDRLDQGGRQSPRTRDPENEQLAIGQDVMGIFRLIEFERDRHLTLQLKETERYGEMTVTYHVSAHSSGSGTRLFVKITSRPRRQLIHGMLAIGDLVMMRKQLLTLKELAEQEATATGNRSES